MRIEAPRVFEIAADTAGQLIVPLYKHKRKSDREGKHQGWTMEKHFVLSLSALAIDAGFNYGTIMLAFFAHNHQAASMLKIAHIIGADTAPEFLTNLTNKAAKRLRRVIE